MIDVYVYLRFILFLFGDELAEHLTISGKWHLYIYLYYMY